MDFGLSERVVLITGASRGIGRATARQLAREGAHLVLAARGKSGLDALEAELGASGARVLCVQADAGSEADRSKLAERALVTFGRVDGIVSNATNLDVYSNPPYEDALWRAHFEVDVQAAAHLVALLSPGMKDRRNGSVVFVSSISGKIGQGHEHGYVAMKAALIAAAKTLAVELAPYGVRVNSVAPGSTYESGGDWDRQEQASPGTIESIAKTIPMGRLGTPEEIADAICFLLSNRSSWIVGHCLVVDGGQYPGVV